ncbi:MAG: hypothetical protein M3Z09_15170, partial [Acidobacteriota bacterium]|nr:hypothetical protein [Acidobacteriota bacterium]
MKFAGLLFALTASAQTLQHAEQLWRQHDYNGANQAFRALVAANKNNAEYRVRWGRLFLERYNKTTAAELFNEALTIQPNYAPALLGLAVAADESFDGKAITLAEKSLAADPKLVEARELIARLKLE